MICIGDSDLGSVESRISWLFLQAIIQSADIQGAVKKSIPIIREKAINTTTIMDVGMCSLFLISFPRSHRIIPMYR
jgi:hypothetical protein